MQDCPFCLHNDLLEGEIIASDEHCYMSEFRGPVLRDAVMIMPLRHVETPFELNEDEWRSTHASLVQAQQFLDRQRPDGYAIGWNVHEVSGQTIPARAHARDRPIRR